MRIIKWTLLGAAFAVSVAVLFVLLRFPKQVLSSLPSLDLAHGLIAPTPFGRVNLQTRIAGDGLHVDATCLECRISDPRLSPTPLLTSNATLQGVLQQERFHGSINFEGIPAELDLAWKDNRASGSVSIPDTQISSLFLALRSIVPEAERAKITGVISGSGTLEWPDMFFRFLPRLKNFSVSGVVPEQTYKKGKFSFPGKSFAGEAATIASGEGTPNWVPLSEVSTILQTAVLAMEDGAYYSHPGFDLANMTEAMEQNRKRRSLGRGGSTITQQLAKNLFLSGERSYARKLRELLYAVELERDLGKRRILELYFNVVEWGPGIYGIGKASQTYFQKKPSELSLGEAAWLASIIRAPKKAWTDQFQKQRVRTHMMQVVLKRMQSKGSISEEDVQQILASPPVFAQSKNAKTGSADGTPDRS